MRIYRRFKLVSVVLMLGTTGIIIGSVLTVPDEVHFIEIIWMLIIALYIFFTMGRWFGYFFVLNGIYFYHLFQYVILSEFIEYSFDRGTPMGGYVR